MTSITPVFVVRSVYESVAWYQRILGFEPVYLNEEPGEQDSLNYAVLRSDGIGLHLGRQDDMSDMLAGQGGCQITTDNFDEIYKIAKDEAVSFYIEMSRNPVGERNFGIQDTDGNRIVINESGS